MPLEKKVPIDVESEEVMLASDISKQTMYLNGLLERARKQGLIVQLSMVAIESVPAIRLDAVYKRLDKPLILRV